MLFNMTRLRIQLLFSHFVMSDSFPLSRDFPRQEHWSGLLFPSPGDLPMSRGHLTHVPCIAGRSFTTEPPGKPHVENIQIRSDQSLSRVQLFSTP